MVYPCMSLLGKEVEGIHVVSCALTKITVTMYS
jgi:hypothetical protein